MSSGNDNPERRGEAEEPAPVIRDKRRIDPETGSVRPTEPTATPAPGAATPAGEPGADTESQVPDDLSGLDASSVDSAAAQLAQERLVDLQRLQAEYVNYRKRVERDRSVARDAAIASVLESLLPVLDDIALARQHGDLEGGPFAAIAEKLEASLGKYGLERYGDVGEEFDPTIHEALFHASSPEATSTTVTQVLQPGYRVDTKVLRPARVAVAGPE
ncbi:MAG: nucleotide exchange factor GrpE [Actinomycetales bacterium]